MIDSIKELLPLIILLHMVCLRYTMADKEDKDWWGIYDKWERENKHLLYKDIENIKLEEFEKIKKEVPCTGKPLIEK